MLSLITLGAIILLSILLVVIDLYFNIEACGYIGLAIFICTIPGFIAIGLRSIDIKNDFKYEIEKYENVKMQVEAYNRDTTAIENVTLREAVLEENNIVSKHKVFSKSKWVGLWYSEEIGNFRKLEMRKK